MRRIEKGDLPVGLIREEGLVGAPASDPAGHAVDLLPGGDQALALLLADSEPVTYGDLRMALDSLIEFLGSERRLLLVEADPSVSTIVLYLAAWSRRHVVFLCPPGRPNDMERFETQFAPDFVARASSGDAISRLEQRDTEGRSPLHSDLSLLLGTSGSTGAAKAVRLSHANLVANARSIVEYLGVTADDRALLNLPIHYSYGLSILNSHLLAGASVMLDSRSLVDRGLWADAMRQQITSFAGVPYSYELLDQIGLEKIAPPSLRYFTQAGGKLPPATASRYGDLAMSRGWKFYVMYGQTEATARMAYLPPEKLPSEPGAIGIPIPGGRFELRDAEGTAIDGIGEPGELIYAGPNVMMGYATCREDLASPALLSELATGDIAERTASGMYKIVGRKSRFLKIFGNRIDLDEVERSLKEENFTAIVTGNDERLVCVATDAAEAGKIEAFVSRLLKLPADRVAMVVASEPPRLPSGKIDYPQLRQIADEQEAATPQRARSGASSVQDAFQRAFGAPALDDSASFLSLGGDSLSYVNIAIVLEEVLGILPEDWEELSIGVLKKQASVGSPPVINDSDIKIDYSSINLWRSALLLFGIVVHVCGMHYEKANLDIKTGYFYKFIVEISNAFRMEAFFILSGFLAIRSLKNSPDNFPVREAKQFLLPVATVTFILLPIANLFYDRSAVFDLNPVHSWFLITLFICIVLARVFIGTVDKLNEWAVGAVRSTTTTVAVVFAVVFFARICTGALLKGHASDAALAAIAKVPYYFLFYWFGQFLAANKSLRRSWAFSNFSYAMVLVSTVCFGAFLYVLGTRPPETHTLDKIMLEACKTFVCISVCCAFIRTILTRSKISLKLDSLTEASLTVYLVHLPILMIIAGLTGILTKSWLEVVLCILVVTMISFALHHLVLKKSRLARLLLNGR